MPESEPQTFADRLKAERQKACLSQYALARQAGISKQALSRLEGGHSEPVWSTVQKIAKALGIDCRSFADPSIEVPDKVEPKKRGRRPKTQTDGEQS